MRQKIAITVFLVCGFASGLKANSSLVIEKCLALKSMVNPAQLAQLEQVYSANLSHKWSNLPVTMAERNGILFRDLSPSQLAIAMQVVEAVMGMDKNQGADEFKQIILADSILAPFNPRYNTGHFAIAFLNSPSLSGNWILQFSGHHFAANFAFSKGLIIGATPQFRGIEPTTYMTAGGAKVQPLAPKKTAFVTLLASLSPEELKLAKLASAPGDLLVGAQHDGQFPATKAGLKVGSLTLLQQSKALAAINAYVQDSDPETAASLMAEYQAGLANTYLSYAGSGTFTTNNDYIRLDGPKVWIEFISPPGVNIANQTHYHSIWRDHMRDYGNDLKGPAITGLIQVPKSTVRFSIGAVAWGANLQLSLNTSLHAGALVLRDFSGKAVVVRTELNGPRFAVSLRGLTRGVYTLSIEDSQQKLRTHFTIY